MQVRIKRGKKQLSSTMTRFNWQCLKDRLNKVYMKKLSHRALSVIRRYDRFERDPIFTSRLLPWALSHILCSKLLKFSHCTYIFFWEFELALKFEFKVLSRDFRFSKKIIEMKSELMNSLLPQKLTTLQFNVSNENEAQIPLISHFSFLYQFLLPPPLAISSRESFSQFLSPPPRTHLTNNLSTVCHYAYQQQHTLHSCKKIT